MTFALPRPPSVNALYRNVPGKGRVKTTRYRSWIVAAGWHLNAAKKKPDAAAGAYELHLTMPRSRTFDIDNAVKAISDLLKTHRLVKDDRYMDRLVVERGDTDGMVLVDLRPYVPIGAPLLEARAA